MDKRRSVAIVGSGPAGLMAASVLAGAGISVTVIEKRPGLGRKLLVAGSSGLNISSDLPFNEFKRNYSGPPTLWNEVLAKFPTSSWLEFIHRLGLETFLGTSGRYFVQGMKGTSLLRAWVDQLKKQGVSFLQKSEVLDFAPEDDQWTLKIRKEDQLENRTFSAICFCLGGGSWETPPPQWPEIFIQKGVQFKPFEAANCGFKVNWKKEFLKEAEGQPLKGILFSSPLGSRAGELMITSYGLEGTPVYSLGKKGLVHIDLKPNLSISEIIHKLQRPGENLNPIRRAKKHLNLSPAALALLFHHTSELDRSDVKRLAERIKDFPIELQDRQPLEEAISSSGGLSWDEFSGTCSLMLQRFPGIFVAGEMIDWTAPTGGFLIQGCVSMGFFAAHEILEFLH